MNILSLILGLFLLTLMTFQVIPPTYKAVQNTLQYQVHLSKIQNLQKLNYNHSYNTYFDKNNQTLIINKGGKVDIIINDVKKVIGKNNNSISFLHKNNTQNLYLFHNRQTFHCKNTKSCKIKVTKNFSLFHSSKQLLIIDFKGTPLKFSGIINNAEISDNFAFVDSDEKLLWNHNGRNIYANYNSKIKISDNFALIENKRGNTLLNKIKTLAKQTKYKIRISNHFAAIEKHNKNSVLLNSHGKEIHKSFRKKYELFDSYATHKGFKRISVFHKSSDKIKFNFLKRQKFIINNYFLVSITKEHLKIYNNNMDIIINKPLLTEPIIKVKNRYIILKKNNLHLSVIHDKEGQLFFRYGIKHLKVTQTENNIKVYSKNEDKEFNFNEYGLDI